MTTYSSENCIPLDLLLTKSELQDDFDNLFQEGMMEGEFAETDLALDTPEAEEEREEAGHETGYGGEEVEEEDLPAGGAALSEDFEDDPVTCYLKEVAGYPLLTQEREIELAQIIRRGEEELVRMVEEHADEDSALVDLQGKIEKLICHEKTFPGVRDKILKVILRTLERGAEISSNTPLFSDLLRRTRSILASIDLAKQEMVKANLRLVLSIAK